MRTHRIYFEFDSKEQNTVFLDKERTHYLKNVLRAKKGQKVRIFNQDCEEFLTLIEILDRNKVTLKIIEKIENHTQSSLNITLVQSISKGDRMDYSVQKATELGVSSILPVFSEYGDVKLDEKRLQKKLSHWQNIAISSSEQSYRSDIPQILTPVKLSEYCQQTRSGIFLEPEETTSLRSLQTQNLKKFDIAIGPEGGWSLCDIQSLKRAGLQGIQFGPRILRTETMAPAILAAIHCLWGDFS